jgi:hypothetical protein
MYIHTYMRLDLKNIDLIFQLLRIVGGRIIKADCIILVRSFLGSG